MAIYTIRRGVDLDAPIVPEGLRGDLYVTENSAHRFIVTATRGGEPVALDGQVVATFIRADGGTEEITGGIDNGAAVVTLPQSCYAVPGRFALTIFNAGADGSTTAVYACVGNVINTTTDTIIDPGSVVPTMTDITAAYNAAQAAVAMANAAGGVMSGALVGFGPYADAYDLIGLCPKTSGTTTDVTWTWGADGRCTITGTASGTRVNNIWSQGNTLPPGMIPGRSFKVINKSSETTPKAYWQLRWYINGTEQPASESIYPVDGTTLTVPADATGVRMRLGVSGTSSNPVVFDPAEVVQVGLVYDMQVSPRGVVADQADLDDILKPGYYALGYNRSYTHAPVDGALTVAMDMYVWPVNDQYITQMVLNPYSGRMYVRNRYSSEHVWTDWSAMPTRAEVLAVNGRIDDECYLNHGTLTNGTDLDDIIGPGYYALGNNREYDNAPVSGVLSVAMEMHVWPVNDQYIIQMVLNPYTVKYYVRNRYSSEHIWTDWVASPTAAEVTAAISAVDTRVDGVFQPRGGVPGGDDPVDLNNVTTEGHYQLTGGVAYPNRPWSGTLDHPAQLEVMKITGGRTMQRITDPAMGDVYVRQSTGGQTDGFIGVGWQAAARSRHTYGKYVAFGDSLTFGTVWRVWEERTIPTYRTPNEYRIPTRIAWALGASDNYDNAALGGAGYLKTAGDPARNIVDIIKAYDFSDVEVVTVMGGANDKHFAEYPLGSQASTAGDGSICGAIKEIIAWFKDNPDNTIRAHMQTIQLIFIQPLPSGLPPQYDPWKTPCYSGGWSLNSFDAAVSEICRAEHVGYVNWAGCTYCDTWAQRNVGYSPTQGETPNYTHPIIPTDYALLGDFIAGKVATYGYNGASIPVPPTTNGAYRLTATVSGGAVTYSWEAV